MRFPVVSFSAVLVFTLVLLQPLSVGAVEVVRMHFSTGALPDPLNPKPYDAFNTLATSAFVDLELFDRDTPVTVANFLNYIDDGQGNHRYDGTFIHRLVPTIDLPIDGLAVMQGGGFIFEPDVGPFSDAFDSGVRHINEDIPIKNEPGLSNVRGTIAMAKQANQPDSATSEWFFNLTDNSAVLDDPANSGGFTVFGQVLGDGLTRVIDLLDRQTGTDVDYMPTFSFGLPVLPDLPLVDFPPGPVRLDQLLLVSKVERVLSVDTSNLDTAFGSVQLMTTATGTIRVINRRPDALIINSADLVNPGGQPFSVLANTCTAGVTLLLGDSCELTLGFSPTTESSATASFDVSFQNNDLSPLSIPIVGQGAPLAAKLGAPANVDFGRVFTGANSTRIIEISNVGGAVGDFLAINNIVLNGGSQSGFTLSGSNSCIGVQLQFGQSCMFSVVLDTSAVGNKTGSITVSHSAGTDVQIGITATVAANPDLLIDSVLDFGQVTQNAVTSRQFLMRNVGVKNLELISFSASQGFTVDRTRGCGSISVLPVQNGCLLIMDVSASSSGQVLDGSLDIQFDASDPATLSLQLTALAMGDGDGISDAIENAGPNNGDGNFDGVPDSSQENVGSLPDIGGGYVTLETEPGQKFIGLRAVDNPSPADSPRVGGGTITFEHGFFDFTIDGVARGAAASVTVHFPEGASPDA